MKITLKTILMGTVAAAAMVSCASDGSIVVPVVPLEECVYMGDKTEFAVWAPDAEAAQLRLNRRQSGLHFFVQFNGDKQSHENSIAYSCRAGNKNYSLYL